MDTKLGKPLLENVFGRNNTIRVLDFLVMGREFDFTLSQIESGTGLSRTAIRRAIRNLSKVDVIEQSREDKKSAYFRINKKSNKYKLIKAIYNKVIGNIIDEN